MFLLKKIQNKTFSKKKMLLFLNDILSEKYQITECIQFNYFYFFTLQL